MTDDSEAAVRRKLYPFADRINEVSIGEPWTWLAAGWRDYRESGPLSLGYGLFYVIVGFVLTFGLYLLDLAYLISLLVTGFILVGPLLAVGLYDISRNLENGRRPSLGGALTAWRRNPAHILAAGLILIVFLIIWIRGGVMIFALSFPTAPLTLESMINATLFSPEGWVFLGLGSAVGAVFAFIAFCGSVASLPMLVDRRVDVFTAIAISVIAVFVNLRVMLLWAALIAVFVFAGLLTFYIGLAVVLPLIGHASWYAYRGLIRHDEA